MVHVQVVTGLAPPKGMTLPFISHGGTSLVVSSLAVGLALGAARRESPRRRRVPPQARPPRPFHREASVHTHSSHAELTTPQDPNMQQIERYGVIALVFLLVTIVAVSFWGDSKSPGFWSRLTGKTAEEGAVEVALTPNQLVIDHFDPNIPLSD